MKHLILIALLAALPARGADHSGGHAHASPYAGMEKRGIKALSDQQIEDLRAGRGMSLALPAELNGYPGPRHVLDFADALALTEAQRTRTQSLFEDMQARAQALGIRVIERERALDALFAKKTATRASLAAAVADAARAPGELRELHLGYHLAMVELLTPVQVARYNVLRGYANAP